MVTANSNRQTHENPSDDLLQNYLRRNRKLEIWAWVSVAIPLIIFLGLSALTVQQGRKYSQLSASVQGLEKKAGDLQKEIDAKNAQLEVKQLAINIVREQNPGQRPKVLIFRPTIAPQVKEALEQLGYSVELRSSLANPSLTDKPVDTLDYGCAVSNEDLRTIATALGKANLPIRWIERATRNKDLNLVQLVASSASNPTDVPINMDTWSRPDKPCAPR
jgi:hypothetical protein